MATKSPELDEAVAAASAAVVRQHEEEIATLRDEQWVHEGSNVYRHQLYMVGGYAYSLFLSTTNWTVWYGREFGSGMMAIPGSYRTVHDRRRICDWWATMPFPRS